MKVSTIRVEPTFDLKGITLEEIRAIHWCLHRAIVADQYRTRQTGQASRLPPLVPGLASQISDALQDAEG